MNNRAQPLLVHSLLEQSIIGSRSSRGSRSLLDDNDDEKSNSNYYRQLPIPAREHGYSNFESTIITNENDYNAFILNVRDGTMGWNNYTGFVDALDNANIHYSSENDKDKREVLVLLRNTQGSGSIGVTFETPTLISEEKKLICNISTTVPEIGTADMAYYCFALVVSTNDVTKVVLFDDDDEEEEFDLVTNDADDADTNSSPSKEGQNNSSISSHVNNIRKISNSALAATFSLFIIWAFNYLI